MFARKDVIIWADLCARIIANKSSDSAIRKATRKVSKEVMLPPGQGAGGIYMNLITYGSKLPDGTPIARQQLIDRAYEVGRDLVSNTPDSTLQGHSLLSRLRIEKPAPQPRVLDRYSQRVDINDPPEEEEDNTPALTYANRRTLAIMANVMDEEEETRRALERIDAPP